MLRYAIPDFRMEGAIDDDIGILKELGVTFKTGVCFGRILPPKALKDGFDAVFAGIGAQAGRLPGVPGEDPRYYKRDRFLKDVYDGKSRVGKRLSC